MIRALVFLLALIAAPAWAAVELLPDSSPQSVLIRDKFSPVEVRVTDGGVPVVDAQVRMRLGMMTVLRSDVPGLCGIFQLDLGPFECIARTDGTGIARFPGLSSPYAGRFELPITAVNEARTVSYGSATAVLIAVPRSAPVQLLELSGSNQKTVMGSKFGAPIVVQVLDPLGRPAVGQEVTVNIVSHQGSVFGVDLPDGQYYLRTGADGLVTTPPISAGWIPGEFTLYVSLVDTEAGAIHTIAFIFKVVTPRGDYELALTNMWWAGPAETGWGVSVVKHGDRMFNVLFIYDADGKPTWYVQPDGRFNQYLSTFVSGLIYQPRSAPWFAYDASKFVPGDWVGNLKIEFAGEAAATLGVAIFGKAVILKGLQPQDFSGDAPSPLQGLADMWWGGPSQNGWGIAIHEQFGNLFSVWFTYDADGKPTWFVMPGGDWKDSQTYAGTIYRTSSSPWIERPYDASQLRVGAAGTYELRFFSRDNARFAYTLDGRSGALDLTRQSFTPD